MAPPPPPPPPPLPEELVEEILLRFPPDDPARLVQAALVCKRWCAIVSGAGFRRRFGKFHRAPPLLGFVSNVRIQRQRGAVEFVPTCSLPASQVHSRKGHVRVVDAHHGRVLLHRISAGWSLPWPDVLMVWDPTTDVQEEVPFPDVAQYKLDWTAAVLCAAGGPCDHIDCRPGPFLIVFVGYDREHVETVLCTYSSSTASWSKPISSNQLPYGRYMSRHVAHVESALYFGVLMTDHILKFDWESQEISWIQMPPTCSSKWPYVLTTTEGGGLGLATIHESSKLYMWSRNDVSQVDATWTQSRVIELKTLLPVHAVLASPRLFGFTVGTGVIFVRSNNVLFVIDLKTYKVIKEVSMASEIYTIIPYMSFYTPGTTLLSFGFYKILDE
ncbi:unnamed protein product [Miscanthus lutarioriparius]|uniref:F-box domain-containing protein n=1 Tax=Miscanthus lutarioriparius TaxID=422564 RepID=A0A811RZS8_9POAL|nr:unnamed protein product [Miscanthus lutarioriparius]